jgi:hypothetical protein
MPIIQALRKLRPDFEFQASLGHTVKPYLKKKKKKKERKKRKEINSILQFR